MRFLQYLQDKLTFIFIFRSHTFHLEKKIYKILFFSSRYFLGWHVYMSEHLDRYPLRSLKYSRFRSKSLKFLLRLKRWIVSRVKKKKKWKKNGISKAGLIRCTAFHEHESMKKHLCFLDLFFCQRQQLCSFLRGLRLYVRSWTIISICSVTLDRVKSKWLSSLKSARKLRSNIDAALVFSHQNSIFLKKTLFCFFQNVLFGKYFTWFMRLWSFIYHDDLVIILKSEVQMCSHIIRWVCCFKNQKFCTCVIYPPPKRKKRQQLWIWRTLHH